MDSMRNERPAMSEAVRHLMAMHDEVVSAKHIAPILKMSESVIVKYAKDGTWDQDNLGKFVISGGHVKFFRKDFLIKCGFMDPEPEEDEPTVQQLLMRIIELLMDTNMLLACGISPADAVRMQNIRKAAGAATPTD